MTHDLLGGKIYVKLNGVLLMYILRSNPSYYNVAIVGTSVIYPVDPGFCRTLISEARLYRYLTDGRPLGCPQLLYS